MLGKRDMMSISYRRTSNATISARLQLALLLTCLAFSACSPGKKASSPAAKPEKSAAAPELLTLPFEPVTRAQVHADDARLGSDNARVTVIAFFDFECPYCANSYASLMQLRRQYSDEDLRIVFKHLPLNFHQSALAAAIAGQAVRDLGGSEAFFAFASLAFENQKDLSFAQIAQWAEAAGISRERYNVAVQDEAVFQKVVQDAQQAQNLGVRGTPAFYFNGKSLKGSQSTEVLKDAVDAELALVQAGLDANAWSALYAKRIEKNLSSQIIDEILDEDNGRYQAQVADSPAAGSPDALVTLVMFTDFECPYCRKMEPTLAALKVKYANQIRLVFKHAPLPFHQLSLPAHQLAEAIYEAKGEAAFFEAAREIFLNSPHLEQDVLLKIAESYGLNDTLSLAALNEPTESMKARLKADAALARDLKANGTPHFFINGRRLAGAKSRAYFEALIDHELLAAKERVASGVSPENLYATLMQEATLPGAPQKAKLKLGIAPHPLSGSKEAKNVIHIFSDYECPYCRRGEQVIQELKQKYGNDLAVVWHDLPLPFHQQAKPAARLARAVRSVSGDEGFWKAHAQIFNLQGEGPALSDPELIRVGVELGLSKAQAKKALTDQALDTAFVEDQALAKQLEISGTPAFIVNGYIILGAQPLKAFERVLN